MAKQMKTLGLCLNLLNPRQKRIYEYVMQEGGANVSDFLRDLVESRMSGQSPQLFEEPRELLADFHAADFI